MRFNLPEMLLISVKGQHTIDTTLCRISFQIHSTNLGIFFIDNNSTNSCQSNVHEVKNASTP